MNTSNPSLSLTSRDPFAVYGPGDKIRGTAHMVTESPVLVKFIIVSLLAGSRISKSPNAKPVQLSFFHKQFKVPFHNKRADLNRQLAAGPHKWDFEFVMPLANNLPPSFTYKDDWGCAEMFYCLVMCCCRGDLPGVGKNNVTMLAIKYAPKRSQEIMLQAPLLQSYLCQDFVVKRRGDPASEPQMRKLRISRLCHWMVKCRKVRFEKFHVTLALPKYAAFNDHLDISMRLELIDEEPLHYIQVKLVKVEYRLWALTRIAAENDSRTLRHQIQVHSEQFSFDLAPKSFWVSLRRHAPFRVQSRLNGMRFDKTSFSSLTPSFTSHNVVREYSLDVDLFISVHGKCHRVSFENNELILLPHDVQTGNE